MTSTPNIIVILADDMGYGDLGCNNPNSKIPTPNLDRLAGQGMRFTDAHAGSSVCTPSRYTLLTGRYAWRSRLKRGIVWEWDGALIEEGRPTVANVLKDAGYSTHCLGKWHLGLDWTRTDGLPGGHGLPFGEIARHQRPAISEEIDYTAAIGGGPLDRGFDSYFGVDVPNFPPYCWFEDRHLTEVPTVAKPDEMYGHAGKMVPGWSLEAMIPEFTRRAVDLIESKASTDEPFFLYYPLTSPHAPIVPNAAFKGRSGIGDYGDFVCEVDWLVGEIMAALERSGQADDTLIIFTSDNGPENLACDYEGCWEQAKRTGHYSSGDWRGAKRDLWEGGHREPFVARWPGHIPAGTVCDHLICLGDLMATCAELTDQQLADDVGEDSISMLSLLQGGQEPTRPHLVYHGMSGEFAIRHGDWVYIDAPSGGPMVDWLEAERGIEPHDHPAELFHLGEDPQECHNRYADEPAIVATCQALLAEAQAVGASADRSTKPVADETE